MLLFTDTLNQIIGSSTIDHYPSSHSINTQVTFSQIPYSEVLERAIRQESLISDGLVYGSLAVVGGLLAYSAHRFGLHVPLKHALRALLD